MTDIVGEAQHDFGRSVPARGDIFSHEPLVASSPGSSPTRSVTPSKTEIANFEFAICVDKKISWLQIAVQNVGRVDIFQTTKSLVNERLEMGIGQWLARTDLHNIVKRLKT